MSEHLSHTTTDHEEIRKWAEERGAKPACVRHTGDKSDVGILRLDFPGYSGADTLQHIEWDEFFEKFDQNNLALVYQEKTASGEKSNFNKLVSRETAEAKEQPKAHAEAQPKAQSKAAPKKPPAKAAHPKTSKAGGQH